ncbi:NRDE family protein [Oceanobacillus halotolerans]|uniref:NRDE family protein n=1 Tax=Oceanobacillus halotolerans TaxID=2663380 RepID=UPI0013DA2EE3|nr:NRDE family protein [Oceanobacillus halotolerans]
MCLINLHFQDHPTYKLIVAANRDEFYKRPTAPAHFWEDEPNILAGRDLEHKGTWLGITKSGRFAALTNYRNPKQPIKGKISRGAIVRNYLSGHDAPEDYVKTLHKNKDNYVGFNVIVGTPDQLVYYNNIQQGITTLSPGTHSLSNQFLNTQWPKVVKGKNMLHTYVKNNDQLHADALFEITSDAEEAQDDELPQTGIGIELERKLSPLFIQTPDYGTRSSTVVLVDHHNRVTFIERTFQHGQFEKEASFSFDIQ